MNGWRSHLDLVTFRWPSVACLSEDSASSLSGGRFDKRFFDEFAWCCRVGENAMSVDLKFQRKRRLFWLKGDPMAFARGPENIRAIVSKISTRRSARHKHAAVFDARTFSSFHIAVQRSSFREHASC